MVLGCKSGWMTYVDANLVSPCGRALSVRRSAEAAAQASILGQMRISGRRANMSKRVRVNIPGVRVNETGCRVLRIIAERPAVSTAAAAPRFSSPIAISPGPPRSAFRR